MSRVRAFFVREAGECLDQARTELAGRAPDPDRIHRLVRRVRGSAQLARFGSLADTALALERRLRRGGTGTGEWSAALGAEVATVLDELEAGVEDARTGRLEQDPRIDDETEAQVAVQAGDAGMGGAGSDPDVTPIEELEYAGDRALDRALDLREPLEDAIVAQDPVGPIIDEIFDLIRLGRA